MWRKKSRGYADILQHVCIRKEEVLRILAPIKVNKSLGPDGIYSKMPWEAREETARALETFASSLASDDISEDWRITHIIPLFKKDNRDKPENYTPVSLASVMGIVMAENLSDRIYFHLESRN